MDEHFLIVWSLLSSKKNKLEKGLEEFDFNLKKKEKVDNNEDMWSLTTNYTKYYKLYLKIINK